MIFKSAVGLVAVIASAATMFAQPATIAPPGQAAKAGFTNLVFNEDFRNLDLSDPDRDTTVWRKNRSLGLPISDDRFSVSNGVLTITTPPGSHRGVCSQITTHANAPKQSKHEFLFGYFEARLRFDWNPDNWDSFWLESAVPVKLRQNPQGSDSTRWCEIDIMEPQNTPRVYAGTVHDFYAGKRVQATSSKIELPGRVKLSDWNTFGALWQPGRVSWYLNNKLVGTTPTPPICDHDRLSLILAAAKQRGDEDQKLEVNWVHVYQ
jgi:beta-glucanase (GH16 family)